MTPHRPSLSLSLFHSFNISFTYSNPPPKYPKMMAVVAPQLVEWSLPNPEVRGTNPVIGNIFVFNIHCQLY